ncbi:MAG: hypothetical protein EOP49_19960 [Sphingobacteriales bacterium]|nr:MAG: hypothetical protein EOP49_19960 [Sphingobacteriales bacterium]
MILLFALPVLMLTVTVVWHLQQLAKQRAAHRLVMKRLTDAFAHEDSKRQIFEARIQFSEQAALQLKQLTNTLAEKLYLLLKDIAEIAAKPNHF